MATVINNPSENSGSGALLAAVILLLIALAALYFGLPYLRGATGGGTQWESVNHVR
jgi:hypothetical protein